MINKYKDFTPEALEYMHGMLELRYEIFDDIKEAASKCFAFRDFHITELGGEFMVDLFPMNYNLRWDVAFGRELYDIIDASGNMDAVINKVRFYEKDNTYVADREDTELLDILTYMFIQGMLSDYVSDAVYYSINDKLFAYAIENYPEQVTMAFVNKDRWCTQALLRCADLVYDVKQLPDGKFLVAQLHFLDHAN